MSSSDPALLQAIRQADAAQIMIYLTALGVAANFLLAFVAVIVPAWQRKAVMRDAKKSADRAWDRFIEAFTAVAAAQNAVEAACRAEYAAVAFTAVEPQLRRAVEALAKASAIELPVAASLNAAAAQQLVAAILTYFPELKVYGRNLITDSYIEAQIIEANAQTATLLNKTKTLREN